MILKNGMRVIVVPLKESLATTVMVLVEAGSKYEQKRISGISHFLEHMCFKGTEKRPRPIDIAGELDGLGAEYNAFTTEEYTSYFVKGNNNIASRGLEIVADMYLHSTFPDAEIEKEKGVIVEEINMYEDNPRWKVQELFMKLVYGDQPAGWGVAGNKEMIKKMTRDDFLAYRKLHYCPQATTMVVAGGFNERAITKEIERYFGSVARRKKGGKLKVIEAQKTPQEKVHFKESDQTHLMMGYRAFSAHDKRRYTLEVLANILGGTMSSRLFQVIREEMGAAYYVSAGTDAYSDHGLLMMRAGVQHAKVKDVIRAGLKEFQKLTKEKVTKEELNRAKDNLVGHLFLSLETSDEIGYYYGGQEVMGMKLENPYDLVKKIKAVTAEDIQKVAKKIIRPEGLNLAVIGPYKNISFRDILKG